MAHITVTEPAFRNVKPTNQGFYIWRIEKLELIAVPLNSYGKFFNGDSYIVFSSTPYGEPGGVDTKIKPAVGRRLEQHIHFWLGADSSQDEAAVAAFKSVELDDLLGGTPVQHREVQGHESKRFLAYFKNGMRILQGGVATGLNHVTEDLTPKLFLVKGKRQPIIRQTLTVSWSEMNEGDVYVLDSRPHVFVWVGKHSNRLERLQAAKLAQKLKEENGDEGDVIFVDDGNEHGLPAEELEIFNDVLPIASKQVKEASQFESDEKEDVRTRKDIKLYQCSDADGTLRISEVKTGPLAQADLNSLDSFIVDNGQCGIYVWVGKKATQKERTEAMRNAQGFIKKKGYKAFTPVTRVVDGGEPAEFKSLFKGWREKDQNHGIMGKTYSNNRGIAKVVQTKFDAETLHQQPAVAAQSRMVDDGKGAREIFRVDHFDLLQVPEEEEGKFYSGDCYVILYAYNNGSKDNYLIYYWLGAHSSQDEQGVAAAKAVELDMRLGGMPVQIRVVQGKEPPHFLAVFHGQLTIFQGGLASSFDGGRNVSVGDTYLLQVHGRTELSTKAIQVDCKASSLNTNDCFILVSPQETYVWLGKGSTGDEREMAKNIAHQTDREPTLIYESQEKPIFWELLGGKDSYMDERILKDIDLEFPARLFHGSNATGNFRLEEIMNFSQADLVMEDVMLLDIGDCILIWLGRYSNEVERRSCIQSAKEYLESDPSDRDKDIPIMVVKQGSEPPNFTGFFGAWDDELFQVDESAAANVGMSNNVNGGFAGGESVVIVNNETGEETRIRFYDIRTLSNNENLPSDVDPTRKELYLNDNDFNKYFGMSKEDFETLPNWKRVNAKKALGLF